MINIHDKYIINTWYNIYNFIQYLTISSYYNISRHIPFNVYILGVVGWPVNGDRMAPAGKAQGMCLVVGLDKDTVEKQCNFPSDCPFWRNQWVYRIISNFDKFRQVKSAHSIPRTSHIQSFYSQTRTGFHFEEKQFGSPFARSSRWKLVKFFRAKLVASWDWRAIRAETPSILCRFWGVHPLISH